MEEEALATTEPSIELPNITRDTLSDYAAAHPDFAQLASTNPQLHRTYLLHFEKISEQLFGGPPLV